MTKIVVSPHLDDEVLGCGGILGERFLVYYCGINESKLPEDPEHRIPTTERREEMISISKFLGFDYEINEESLVNHYDIQDFIGRLEAIFNEYEPDTVFVPYPSYNQDHKTIYEAALIALRPHDRNFFVPQVVIYEQPHVFLWDDSGFQPNYFIEIDIERKLKAYGMYRSQVRSFRSPDTIRDMARLRGKMGGFDHAEGFEVLRLCEKRGP